MDFLRHPIPDTAEPIPVTRRSILTGQVRTIILPLSRAQLRLIETPGRKELIQDIVPHLNDDEREFLLSGITPEEWQQHVGTEEEED